MWEPQKLHDEHREWKADLLTGATPAMSRESLEAVALAMLTHQQAHAGAH